MARERGRPRSRRSASSLTVSASARQAGVQGSDSSAAGVISPARQATNGIRDKTATSAAAEKSTATGSISRIVDSTATRPASVHNYANVNVRAIRADLKAKGLSDADIEAKFRLIATPVLGQKKTDAVVSLVWRLETLPDLGDLLRALQP